MSSPPTTVDGPNSSPIMAQAKKAPQSGSVANTTVASADEISPSAPASAKEQPAVVTMPVHSSAPMRLRWSSGAAATVSMSACSWSMPETLAVPYPPDDSTASHTEAKASTATRFQEVSATGNAMSCSTQANDIALRKRRSSEIAALEATDAEDGDESGHPNSRRLRLAADKLIEERADDDGEGEQEGLEAGRRAESWDGNGGGDRKAEQCRLGWRADPFVHQLDARVVRAVRRGHKSEGESRSGRVIERSSLPPPLSLSLWELERDRRLVVQAVGDARGSERARPHDQRRSPGEARREREEKKDPRGDAHHGVTLPPLHSLLVLEAVYSLIHVFFLLYEYRSSLSVVRIHVCGGPFVLAA
eukprot:scaffold198230_cov30-Tisochrysis_lutea.AAC.4